MKVYLFDISSGLYLGEDYWDSRDVLEAEGATNLAPPKVRYGQLPVYDRSVRKWKLVPIGSLQNSGAKNE
ncbi:hypothetical protein [Geomonas oryzae]|uniref:hypothetical protein n=1 Tax=Geomonas oryzae TaxID=2364273 RepID=UPI00100B5122|nr:hypothetical protein [Geomonas oryzae]